MAWVDPEVRDAPPPDIEVLIKEARRRRRRRQARAAGALLALVGVGFGAGFGFFGNGDGGGGQARNGGDGGAAGGAPPAAASLSAAPVIASAPFAAADYQLSVQHGQVAVTPDSGFTEKSCRLLSPRTLRTVDLNRRCNTPSNLPRGIVVGFHGAGAEVRVKVRNPMTGRTKVSPKLFTLDNWDWAHSGAVEGDGAFWIYELKPPGSTAFVFEVSAGTGALLHRFTVDAGADPFMTVDADGFWITESGYGGGSCIGRCTLWHVVPGAGRVVAQRRLGVRTQWLIASGHSIYVDVLANARDYGFSQTIWRMDGSGARVVYRTPATLLPSTAFGIATGYGVIGNPQRGFFTLTDLGRGRTPIGSGDCVTAAPIRLVRVDPATGTQSYVATMPQYDAGSGLDCHLYAGQAVLHDGAFFVLAGEAGNFPAYTQVVRLPT
jgi:hypothetical protein